MLHSYMLQVPFACITGLLLSTVLEPFYLSHSYLNSTTAIGIRATTVKWYVLCHGEHEYPIGGPTSTHKLSTIIFMYINVHKWSHLGIILINTLEILLTALSYIRQLSVVLIGFGNRKCLYTHRPRQSDYPHSAVATGILCCKATGGVWCCVD